MKRNGIEKPIGYHTREYMLKYGYSEADVAKLEAAGAVKCFHGAL